MTEAHLSVRDLDAGYGEVSVLGDIAFDVARGSITAILGANGAGKTTLLSAIAGLLSTRRGTIHFEGTDIAPLDAAELPGRGLVLVPEGGRLFPFMSVRENLELGAYSGGSRDGVEARIEEVCRIFPILAERRRQLAGRLSGGERQMCAVARALMAQPRLLMLDEPSVGLSPLATETLLETVAELAHTEGLTIVIVEQRVTEVLEIAQDVHILDHGHIVRSGRAAELKDDSQIRETYMGL